MNLTSCSHKCWYAKREKCICICGGKNHKIGTQDFISSEFLEKLEEKFKKYKELRRHERKMERKMGKLSFKPESQKMMNQIIKAHKKR